MSEIKVNKIKPALNPVKVTIDSGIAVNDETRLSDRQQSFGVNQTGQIELFAPLNIGSLTQTSSGNINQVLISRGSIYHLSGVMFLLLIVLRYQL